MGSDSTVALLTEFPMLASVALIVCASLVTSTTLLDS